MFGSWLGGMFGGNKPMPMDLNQGPDALGQAAAGAPMAMGAGREQKSWLAGMLDRFNSMDPMQKQMMMSRVGRGFSMGMNGFNSGAQTPQMGPFYRPMSGPQRGGWFNPNGGM